MRKTLVFDSDRSLASIGSPEFQDEVFGFPPVACASLFELQNHMLGLVTANEKPRVHPILETATGMDVVTTFNPKAKDLGLRVVALDTFSHAAKQSFRLIVKQIQGRDNPDHIDRGVWFQFRDHANRVLAGLAKMDFPVIVNCHTRREEGDTGDVLVPSVVTELRGDMPQYFDVVMFAGKKTVNKVTHYYWHTEGSGRYNIAKIRHPRVRARVPAEIPQDFNALLNIFEEEGKHDPKILVLADSGYGKTSALATLGGYYPPQFTKKTD